MPHKRETQMVCNLHFPTGTTYFRFLLEFGIEGYFRRENLTSFLVGWKTLLTIAPAGERTPRPPAHPDFMTSKESHTLLVRPYVTMHVKSWPKVNWVKLQSVRTLFRITCLVDYRKSYVVIICASSCEKLTKSEIGLSCSRFEHCLESLI